MEKNIIDRKKLIKYISNILQETNITIEVDERGHSSAIRYIVYADDNKYFMKIYKENREKNIDKIQSIYERLNIPTAKIISNKYESNINKTVVIYEYIEGNTLFELTKLLKINELEDIGIKIGKEIKKFETVEVTETDYKEQLEQEIKKITDSAIIIKNKYEIECGSLPYIDLERLINSFNNLKNYILDESPMFIHNDINYKNIIVRDGIPYFIDTDGGKIKFRALDFRGICWWGWKEENKEKERAIYRGIFKGIFNNNVPVKFHKQIEFTMIYEFLSRLNNYKEHNNETEYAFTRFKPIFDECNYFENFTFEWFK